MVLSVDEKSQIQGLDRTQPLLPMRPGIPERQTHDYERYGTATLFAALNVLDGTVIGHCQPRPFIWTAKPTGILLKIKKTRNSTTTA